MLENTATTNPQPLNTSMPLMAQQRRAQDACIQITQDVSRFLKHHGNELSSLHQDFIAHLVGNYVDQYLGVKEPIRALIEADPGLGKTTCLRFFLRWLIRSLREGQKPVRGVLVCTNVIRDLESHLTWLQEELGDVSKLVALHHSQPSEHRIEPAEKLDSFPIVLATQAKIRRQTTHNGHGMLAEVAYFRGKPRLVCWDEEAKHSRVWHFEVCQLRGLLAMAESLRFTDPELADFIGQRVKPLVQPILDEVERANGNEGQVALLKTDDAKEIRDRLVKGRKKIPPSMIEALNTMVEWPTQSAYLYFRKTDRSNDDAMMEFIVELPSQIDRAVITDASAVVSHLVHLDPKLTVPSFMRKHGRQLKTYDDLEILWGSPGFADKSIGVMP